MFNKFRFRFKSLSKNFWIALGKVLKINSVLQSINLGKNYRIIDSNYKYKEEGLVENHSIISFGELIDKKIGVKYREFTEKIIQLNKTFLDKKIEKEKALKAKEESERIKSKKNTNRKTPQRTKEKCFKRKKWLLFLLQKLWRKK